MTKQHTPWTVESSTILQGDKAIATVYGGNVKHQYYDNPSEEEAKANARLIAAAPDILKELQESTDCLWLMASVQDNQESKAALMQQIRQNRAAIAKAKGEA